MISPLILLGGAAAAAFFMTKKASAAPAVAAVANVPNYAQPSQWPTVDGIEPDIPPLMRQIIVKAIAESRDVAGIQELAGITAQAGYPIAAQKLTTKAQILARLKMENHWIMAGT